MTRFGERTRSGTRVNTFAQRPSAGIGYGVATGGTSSSITVVGLGNFTMLTFTGAGTLTVTKAGLFDLLIIGGGSSGLAGWYGNGRPGSPGGGAGGALETTVYFSTNQTVTIGAGGADPTSAFEYFLGADSFVGAELGSGGASGRGGAPSWSSGGNTAPVPAQKGFDGFSGASNDGGGGGGQGGAATTRNGGAGFDWSLWRGEVATTKYYGGGGGGQSSGGTSGTGGVGGGGGGTVAGSANTGGGGGGGDQSGAAGGGSGIVLVRFKV